MGNGKKMELTARTLLKIDDNQLYGAALDYILKHEGGFVEHKNDSGKATKYGISLKLLNQLQKKGDLELADVNKDGVVNRKDIIDLPYDLAKTIYVDVFLEKIKDIGVQFVSRNLAVKIMDIAANCGVSRAVKILQQAINNTVRKHKSAMSGGTIINNDMFLSEFNSAKEEVCKDGEFIPLSVDGVAGNLTKMSLKYLAGYLLITELGEEVIEEQKRFYERLVKANPKYKVFEKGWMKRAETFPRRLVRSDFEK